MVRETCTWMAKPLKTSIVGLCLGNFFCDAACTLFQPNHIFYDNNFTVRKVFHLTHFRYNLIIKIVLKIYYFHSHLLTTFFSSFFSFFFFCFGTQQFYEMNSDWSRKTHELHLETLPYWSVYHLKASQKRYVLHYICSFSTLLFSLFSYSTFDNGIRNLFRMVHE